MKLRVNIASHLILSAFVFLTAAGIAYPVLAQDEVPQPPVVQDLEEAKKTEEELVKKALTLLDELITDSATLNGDENRNLALGIAIELLWKHDEKRARILVYQVMNQIISQNAAYVQELEQRTGVRSGQPRNPSGVRQQLVNFLAGKDSKLALEFLRLTKMPLPENRRQPGWNYQDQYMEGQLAARVAQNDPQIAMEMAEEALKNGLNYQTLEILNSLRAKQPQLAMKLSGEIINKLKTLDMLSSYDHLNIAFNLLGQLRGSVNPPPPPPTSTAAMVTRDFRAATLAPAVNSAEAQQHFRDLLGVITDVALRVSTASLLNQQGADIARNLFNQLQTYLPEVDRQFPSRSATLRAKVTQYSQAMNTNPHQKYFESIQGKSPQEIVEVASTAPQGVSESLYHEAFNRAIQKGDRETARKIARENIANPWQGSQMLATMERQEADRLIQEGNFDEARAAVMQLGSEEDKVSTLARWAETAIAKMDEKNARLLLDEARSIIGDQMQTRGLLEAQMAIANTYLNLDLDQSCTITEAAIERLNKFIASALEYSSFMRARGDDPDQSAGMISFTYAGGVGRHIMLLARKDFDRAVGLLRRWQMNEVRVMMGLTMLRGVLGDERNTSNPFQYRSTLRRAITNN
ncbi:MAG: hypothetical protein L0220_21080 [Acidobacteria bacterium]|nr:hypothetical protein [Acidobacteriota bacterium]